MPDELKPKGLIAKLCEVMAEAGYIQKRGHNEKFNYDYATEADVVDALRDKLAARNVFVFPSIISAERKEHSKTNSGGTMFITDIMVKWTFLDGDSGETQECVMPGCGTDTGDKGVYKAITGSSKYLFLKAFMLPTGDDPENEKADGKTARATKAAPPKQSMPASTSPNPCAPTTPPSQSAETVTMTPHKNVFIALSGPGVPIVMSNLDGKAKAALQLTWEGSTAIIPAARGWAFKDMCEKCGVKATFADAASSEAANSGVPKANIPAWEPLDPPEPSTCTDPVIVSAKRVQGKKEGAKEFLSVEWDGKKASCWSKTLWPHLEHYVGRPARLTLSENGQYKNVTGIVSLDGEPFEEQV